jgi:thioester reductase-like protein
MFPDDTVLLTGFPSLLARTVCAELVQSDPRTRVHALVRPRSTKDVDGFLRDLAPDQRKRVNIVEGDASAIDFGLSGAEFKALAAEVTRIHHCAQLSHLAVDLKGAERVNVGAAREAIEFASCCTKLSSLVFHSTAYVSGDRTGVVHEADLKAGQAFRNIVEETTARAEKLMRAAMTTLPVTVVRPATIVGDSRTGEVDRFDGPYLLIVLVVTSPPDIALPLPGRGDAPLNLVPIDWVAQAAVAIGRDRRARGRTFHLVDPKPLTTRRVFEIVAKAGGRPGPRGSIPANIAKAVLRAPGLERITKSPRALLETLTTPVTYDAANANELFAALGVAACPPFESYADKLVDYVKTHVRRRRESKTSPPPGGIEDPVA